jgi:hypothetical protein
MKPSESAERSERDYIVEGFDSKLKDYLKSNNEKIKAGSLNLAKTIPYKDGPQLKLSLNIKVVQFEPGRGGVVEVFSRVNWGFPEFADDKLLFEEKKVSLIFEDIIILRNKLAKILETACELFP